MIRQRPPPLFFRFPKKSRGLYKLGPDSHTRASTYVACDDPQSTIVLSRSTAQTFHDL